MSETLGVGESIAKHCPCRASRFSFEFSNHSFHSLGVSSIVASHALIQYQRIVLCATPVAAQRTPELYSLLVVTQWAVALQKEMLLQSSRAP